MTRLAAFATVNALAALCWLVAFGLGYGAARLLGLL
jgi:hypothetical protein